MKSLHCNGQIMYQHKIEFEELEVFLHKSLRNNVQEDVLNLVGKDTNLPGFSDYDIVMEMIYDEN